MIAYTFDTPNSNRRNRPQPRPPRRAWESPRSRPPCQPPHFLRRPRRKSRKKSRITLDVWVPFGYTLTKQAANCQGRQLQKGGRYETKREVQSRRVQRPGSPRRSSRPALPAWSRGLVPLYLAVGARRRRCRGRNIVAVVPLSRPARPGPRRGSAKCLVALVVRSRSFAAVRFRPSRVGSLSGFVSRFVFGVRSCVESNKPPPTRVTA